MDIEAIRAYCLNKKAVSESLPFNDSTLVFKVLGKMFALLNLDIPHSISLKCEPEKAIRLRERYASVKPGYHMNKKHWNTVNLDHDIRSDLLTKWIDESYELIVQGLPKKTRMNIE